MWRSSPPSACSFRSPLATVIIPSHETPPDLSAPRSALAGMISCGLGSTSVREWLPKGVTFPNPPTIESRVEPLPDGSWTANGVAYETFVTRMKSAGLRGFRAVLWHQGESDANQRDCASARVRGFISRERACASTERNGPKKSFPGSSVNGPSLEARMAARNGVALSPFPNATASAG